MKINLLMIALVVFFLSGCAEDLKPRSINNTKSAIPGLELIGLDLEKPITLEVKVQVAYNSDTIFFYITWHGDRGDSHDYLNFINGTWNQVGSHRRDAQSTIDRDPLRGKTDVVFTSAESSVSFFLNDPSSEFAVPGFERFGCFMACHDDSQYMPEWQPQLQSQSELSMYLPGQDSFIAGRLDLWHLSLARGNPIGWGDDQNVTIKTAGGRIGDKGDAPYESNVDTTGGPKYVLDGSKTRGVYFFKLIDILQSPYRFFMRPDTKNISDSIPFLTPSIEYFRAEEKYIPQDGDSIPGSRLRNPTDSRGDISAIETYFEPDEPGSRIGTNHVNLQRKLDTRHRAEDTELADGNTYDIAFAINTGNSGGRDHYVSLPMTLSLEGPPGDIKATKINNKSGTSTLPEFANNVKYPETIFNVFLPGITSYEFLTGQNENKNYFKKSGDPVDQVHEGSTSLSDGSLGCRDCHTVKDEAFTGRLDNLGKLADLVTKRGGVYTPTPLKKQ